jgi:hypothetical protein
MIVLFLVALPVAVAAFTTLFWAISRLATTPDLLMDGSLRVAGYWFVAWFLGVFFFSVLAMVPQVSSGRTTIAELIVFSSLFALGFALCAAVGSCVQARRYRSLQRRRVAFIRAARIRLRKLIDG